MKLSLRLPLLSISILTLAILLCCGLLLITTGDTLVGSAMESAEAELRILQSAVHAELERVPSIGSAAAQRSLLLYTFRLCADVSRSDTRFMLTDGDKVLYNDSPADPRPPLPADGLAEGAVAVALLDGRRYVVAGQQLYMGGGTLHAYLVRDITEIYEGIYALGRRFALIALITIAVSAAALILILRRALLPLRDLQRSAAALAEGEYKRRISVRGKDEISELGTRFNRMADAIEGHIATLEETAENRKLLLSALTHELKTPMTAIIGYSELLLRVKLSAARRGEALAYIHSECSRLERLSQKMMRLVALSGGESADILPQPLRKLMEAVEQSLREIAEQSGIALHFEYDREAVLPMDCDLMNSLLVNLFDNAHKAGATQIEISADAAHIAVTDNGIGIPADKLPLITQPFYTGDGGGSGIGLALCERIAQAHGAILTIESSEGVGTRVEFALNVH
ncbi:MAG: HAMP domain-containing histidine kinase [Clostridiales bacterium]|nr:HAMP domain-containing histidine kinase [Clostridiales bacterium]